MIYFDILDILIFSNINGHILHYCDTFRNADFSLSDKASVRLNVNIAVNIADTSVPLEPLIIYTI